MSQVCILSMAFDLLNIMDYRPDFFSTFTLENNLQIFQGKST